jgi:diaminopimelate decarboxylase
MFDPAFAARLAARFGTPLYAYDLDVVAGRARDLQSILPPGARLHYSFKANPLPAVGRALREAGCSAEVTSMGELDAAIEAGFAPGAVLYTGPGKTAREIAHAIEAGVRRFTCESWADADRLRRSAQDRGTAAEALLRVEAADPRGGLAMGGGTARFGFDEEDLIRGKGRLAGLDVAGVHVFQGSQIPDAASLVRAFRAAADAAERVTRALGVRLRAADLGGGFPWPYAVPGAGPDLAPIRAPLAEIARSGRLAGAELIFESGRSLVAPAGVLVARVVDVRTGRGGARAAVLDGGINVLGGMAALGRILRPAAQLARLGEGGGEPAAAIEIAGPACTPLDVIAAPGTPQPSLSAGDLVAVPNVGAYGITSSLVAFLSRPPPLEVVHRGGEVIGAYRLRAGHEVVA